MAGEDEIEVHLFVNGQCVGEYSSIHGEQLPSVGLGVVQLNMSIESIPNANYEIELITRKGFPWSARDSWDILSFAIEIDGVRMGKILEHVPLMKHAAPSEKV